MRLIDADTLYMNLVKMKDFGELTAKKSIRAVENEPTIDLRKVTQDYESDTTIDAVTVIRCRDCKHGMAYYHGEHSKLGTITYCCKRLLCDVKADDYCSRAERKDND